jgi:hypothetical protein
MFQLTEDAKTRAKVLLIKSLSLAAALSELELIEF